MTRLGKDKVMFFLNIASMVCWLGGVACTFDVKVHGIPEDINLHTPDISLLPAPKDAGIADTGDQ